MQLTAKTRKMGGGNCFIKQAIYLSFYHSIVYFSSSHQVGCHATYESLIAFVYVCLWVLILI